jgi:hypothetical protein
MGSGLSTRRAVSNGAKADRGAIEGLLSLLDLLPIPLGLLRDESAELVGPLREDAEFGPFEDDVLRVEHVPTWEPRAAVLLQHWRIQGIASFQRRPGLRRLVFGHHLRVPLLQLLSLTIESRLGCDQRVSFRGAGLEHREVAEHRGHPRLPHRVLWHVPLVPAASVVPYGLVRDLAVHAGSLSTGRPIACRRSACLVSGSSAYFASRRIAIRSSGVRVPAASRFLRFASRPSALNVDRDWRRALRFIDSSWFGP